MKHKNIAIACAGELKTIINQVVITSVEDFEKIIEEILELTTDKNVGGLDTGEVVLNQDEFRRLYSFLVHNCTIDIKNE